MLGTCRKGWKAVRVVGREFFSSDKTQRLSSKRLIAFAGMCLFTFNTALCAYVILYTLHNFGPSMLPSINLAWYLYGDMASVGMAAPLAVEAWRTTQIEPPINTNNLEQVH
jgi:hypothetical protein